MAVGDMWHATAGNGGAASIRPASGTEVMLTAFDVAFSNSSNYSYCYLTGSGASGYNHMGGLGSSYQRSPKAKASYNAAHAGIQGLQVKIHLTNTYYIYSTSYGSSNGGWFGGVVTK